MKIAIFSDNFYPEMSGISDSIILIAKGLAQKGHLVNFYVPRYSRKDFSLSKKRYQELALNKNISIFRLPSLPYPSAPTRQGRFALPILSSLRHVKKFDPDIIYTQDFFSAGLEALVCSKILKKPLIGTSHTPIVEFLKYSPVRFRWTEKLILKYVSWYYNQCLLTSAPAQSLIDEMKEYGFREDHLIISNPIDLENFHPAKDEEAKNQLKKKFGLSPRTVIYTGRLGEEKRIDLIIRAVSLAKKKFPEISLAITGHGNAEERLKKLVKKLRLEKNVFFFGYVEPNTLTSLYQAADIFAVMSSAETQCMSMMQAMSANLPVLGANSWGLAEYINPQNGYLVQPDNYEELAEKISYLFENPEEIRRLGRGGAEYVKNFSLSSITQAWEDIFSNTLKTRESMKLSIVIPAYNEEAYLAKCLESVIKETKNYSSKEIEIILVNNASTDKTKEIALQYPEVIVVDESRKGLSRARQSGFEASTGDLIANIDADTLMPPGWIAKVYSAFESNEEMAAISGPYIYYDSSLVFNISVFLYYFFAYLIHLVNHYILGVGAVLQGGNFILRRTSLEEIKGFDTNIEFYGEDTDIARRIQKVGQVKFSFFLYIRTSSRRFQKEGILATAMRYVFNYFWIIFFKKPFTRDYTHIAGKEETEMKKK